MRQAVIITENQYPCADAGAIRQHATAKILESLGFSVVVLGYGQPTGKRVLNYAGIDYTSFRPASQNKYVRMAYRFTVSGRMMRFLKKNYPDAEVILLADVFSPTFKKAYRYSKNKNTILIHDSVEWFSPEQFSNGEKSATYKMRDRINRNIVSGKWRVMAISSYLEEHFSKQCDKAVRIPVIMDVDSIECNLSASSDRSKVKFAYVGSPGRKDYLKNIIEGFALLSEDIRKNIELNIVGVTKAQLVSACGAEQKFIDALGNSLVAHGRVPHAEAEEFVRNSDFTLLLRDASLRYAKAGFPTKIVESLSCGTPPICNLSSDLGLYLRDGENSILADGFSSEAVKVALEKALDTDFDKRRQLRAAARLTAEEQFDYHHYISQFLSLIVKQ